METNTAIFSSELRQPSVFFTKQEIPQPPDDMLGPSDKIARDIGEIIDKGVHIASIQIGKKKISPQALLPDHMKKFYGYSRDPLAEKTFCHTTAIMWHYPDFHTQIELDSLEGTPVGFIKKHSDEIPIEEACIGDICLTEMNISDPPPEVPAHKTLHSCIFVTPELVFTKNGAGSSQPFLLWETKDVVTKYSPLNPRVKITLQARRLRSK